METSLITDYDSKREDYYNSPRPEMLDFVPISNRKILDVGCGRGIFGRALRRRGECEVWGVEPDAECIPEANTNLNKVIHSCFATGLDLPEKYFDCIIFNDVLEHMLDPASALLFARNLLSPAGRIVASIPNIGHFPTVWRLAVRGEWDYKEFGILDKTHLRFFTRKAIIRLFEGSGFAIEQLKGINAFLDFEPDQRAIWRRYSFLSWVPVAGIKDMRYLQFAVVARLNQ